jgi:hypothetical protein
MATQPWRRAGYPAPDHRAVEPEAFEQSTEQELGSAQPVEALHALGLTETDGQE